MYKGNPYKNHKIAAGGEFGSARDDHLHSGLDYLPLLGKGVDPVKAILDGKYRSVGEDEIFGKFVTLDHNLAYLGLKGWIITVYLHLHFIELHSENFVRGNGTILGTMGNSGYCIQDGEVVTAEQQEDLDFTGGTHLHLGVVSYSEIADLKEIRHFRQNGAYFYDPIEFMQLCEDVA